MSKSDILEAGILKLIFNATTIDNIAANTSSSAATVLWASLHTADPADTGQQGTSEVALTAYARTSVARTTAGFVVTTGATNSVSPVAAVTFPTLTSTSTGTATHAGFGLSSASTGGILLYKGAISPTIALGQNVTPALTTASQISED
jgi:hypothetical protein